MRLRERMGAGRKTTLAGAAAAGLSLLGEATELPPAARVACKAGAAAALALLGYHASDCPSGCRGSDKWGRRIVGGVLIGALALAVVGCRTAGFHFKVSNPTFGSLVLEAEPGVIGKGAVPKAPGPATP